MQTVTAELLDPFVSSTDAVFQTMLAATLEHGEPKHAAEVSGSNVVLSVIGMKGEDVRGAVALTIPFTTAVNLANRVLGTDKTEPDSDVSDAVAEITNMIAGGAKAHLVGSDGSPIQLGLPVVSRNAQATLDHPAVASWTALPFESELGPFTLFVSFDKAPQ